MVSGWLDERTEGDGGVPHALNDKPYAVQGVSRLGSAVSAVQFALLDDGLGTVLAQRVQRGSVVACGAWSGAVLGLSMLDQADWGELCSVRGDSRWVLRFGPTTFRSGQVYSPWPDPVTVITGVHRRLKLVYPDGFGELARMRSDSVWVSRCALQTVSVQLKAGRRPAVVGEVDYEADRRWEGAAEVEKVFRCVRFAGVGAHTTHGLGVVQVQASRR